MCVVSRENAPSAVGREGTTLNVGNDIVVETPLSSGLGLYDVSGVALLNPLGEVFELRNTSPDVDQNISSRIERTTSSSNHGDTIVPTPEGCKVSLKRRPGCQVLTVKRQASEQLHSDNSDTLYTLVNGVTGQVEGNTSLETLPSGCSL